MMEVTVEVQSVTTGGASGAIHMVFLPCHLPTPLASCSWFLPGLPASMQACMSSWVQPGGSLISCAAGAAGVLASLGCAAIAIEPETIARLTRVIIVEA